MDFAEFALSCDLTVCGHGTKIGEDCLFVAQVGAGQAEAAGMVPDPGGAPATIRRRMPTPERTYTIEEANAAGVLTLLALPRFMNVATRAKMSEAKMMLRQVHALQKSYYMEHDVYAQDLVPLQFEPTPLVTDGGTARYRIAIEQAQGAAFVATATSVVVRSAFRSREVMPAVAMGSSICTRTTPGLTSTLWPRGSTCPAACARSSPRAAVIA